MRPSIFHGGAAKRGVSVATEVSEIGTVGFYQLQETDLVQVNSEGDCGLPTRGVQQTGYIRCQVLLRAVTDLKFAVTTVRCLERDQGIEVLVRVLFGCMQIYMLNKTLEEMLSKTP